MWAHGWPADVKIFQYAPGYNDGIIDYNKERTTISRKVHCSQGSFYDLSRFVKLLDSDLVRAAVTRRTTRGLSKFVDIKWSTICNWNFDWVFATCRTIAKADRPGNFTIFHYRMSTIQPAWPVCTTFVCWYTCCWHFSSGSSHKTVPSLGEWVVTKHWTRERCTVTAFPCGIT